MLQRKNKAFSILYLTAGLLVALPSLARADCASPAAPAGRIEYFSAGEQVFKYCNGTDWISWGSGGTEIWSDTGLGYIQYDSSLGGIVISPIIGNPAPQGAVSTSNLSANAVLESHLKAVDTAADEECLTFETTTGDFEWQTCGAGGAEIWTDSGLGYIQYDSAMGGILVGTTTGSPAPQGALGGGGGGFWTSGTGDDIYYNATTPQVGIGKTSPIVALDVVGDINYTGVIVDVSDIRMKYDIVPLENPLTKVTSLNGFYFKMKNDPDENVELGVSAQDVNAVFPELVRPVDENGTLGVSYNGLIAPMVEAIKELKAENDALRARVEILERQQTQQSGER